MNANIMIFKNRNVCALLNDGDYTATITKQKVYTKGEVNCLIVDFEVNGGEQGNKTITYWFYDSSKEEEIIFRKQFFTALNHPEWGKLEQFNIDMLSNLKVGLSVGHYTSKKTGEEVNAINKFMPIESVASNTSIKASVGKIPFDDDITF